METVSVYMPCDGFVYSVEAVLPVMSGANCVCCKQNIYSDMGLLWLSCGYWSVYIYIYI